MSNQDKADDPKMQVLAGALNSDEIRNYINNEYKTTLF